jgi:hypothetical protein
MKYYNQSLCLNFATPFSSLWLIFFRSSGLQCELFKVLSLSWPSPELLVIMVFPSLSLLLGKHCTVGFNITQNFNGSIIHALVGHGCAWAFILQYY